MFIDITEKQLKESNAWMNYINENVETVNRTNRNSGMKNKITELKNMLVLNKGGARGLEKRGKEWAN